MAISVSLPRLKRRIGELAQFGKNPDGLGITRVCWSPPHEAARHWLIGEMRAAGLTTWVDPAGNVLGRLGGGPEPRLTTGGPVVMTGSHIDTVPQGGPLDGALGVLAGLECLETIARARLQTERPLVLAAWSDEEGRYGGLFGSRAFTGKLDPRQITSIRAVDGDSLVDAMSRAGFDAHRAVEARADPRALWAYLELHIEQGPHLEAASIPIGVVEGIVGIRRRRLHFVGEPDHAGATPMARRKDSFLAAAEYALKARDLIVKRGGGRSVTNFGWIEVTPGVSNIVPAHTALLQEMRERDPEILDRLDRQCQALARSVARRRRVHVRLERLSESAPASCSPRTAKAVVEACRDLGLPYRRMTSAAGHDAQNLATVTHSGMLFIPSQGGRSHRPDEWSDWPAIARGTNVLLRALLKLAGSTGGGLDGPLLTSPRALRRRSRRSERSG
jgi:beta-ureidopropionase / N-carbamoyl-L-amino-acid hydrolase